MTNQRNSAGFSLIEVLIALVIISVGLIGLAALQARALQFNQGSYLRRRWAPTTLPSQLRPRRAPRWPSEI
jgi:prepilin-type N-terminal cleavage/methylation domain-containing protein